MKNLEFKPYIGIGEVLLGMSREKIHEVMGKNFMTYKRINTVDTYYSSCFQIHYDKDNLVEFIELANGITDYFDVKIFDIDIFKTKAEELVKFIEKYSTYDRNNPGSISGYDFIFKDIGLSLWRPQVFKEDFLQEPWFLNLSQENKEYELKYRYFEAAGLAVKGYWNK